MTELKENQFTFVDEKGDEIVCDIIITYYSPEFKKNYVVFSPVGSEDEDGDPEINIASYVPKENGIGDLSSIEDETEWNMITEAIYSLVEENDCDCDEDEEKNRLKNCVKGDTVEFGSYPQTIKADDVTIINTIRDSNGYYTGSDGEKYALLKAYPFKSENTFSNGLIIKEDKEYYFKVEPIKWKVLEDNKGKVFLFSKVILDTHRFDNRSKNYKVSSIRSWLNNEFYSKAFTDEQKVLIESTALKDTSNVTDKVFLLSKKEITETSYGFSKNKNKYDYNRCKKLTDYAKAKYAFEYEENKNGAYWLRTQYSSLRPSIACVVDFWGSLYKMHVIGDHTGVVPALILCTIDYNLH